MNLLSFLAAGLSPLMATVQDDLDFFEDEAEGVLSAISSNG